MTSSATVWKMATAEILATATTLGYADTPASLIAYFYMTRKRWRFGGV
jgi:hypothetical protein